MLSSNLDVSEMFVERESQRSSLHARYLNEQLVRVLKTIGYDVGFQKGQGQYLFDREGARYLDLLSGFSVFAIGRNHPALREALKSVLDSDLPNLVQLDVSTLAGVLAERLLEYVPYLDKVFFANSGAETVEAAIKFARGATGRPGIVSCSHSFHGLSYGALSHGRRFHAIRAAAPVHQIAPARRWSALSRAGRSLHRRADPGQSQPAHRRIPAGRLKSMRNTAPSSFRRTRPVSAAPENSSRSSTGISSRHGATAAKPGGHVPVGALLTHESIFDKIFLWQMDRAVITARPLRRTIWRWPPVSLPAM